MEIPTYLNTDSAYYAERIKLENVLTAIQVNLNPNHSHKGLCNSRLICCSTGFSLVNTHLAWMLPLKGTGFHIQDLNDRCEYW